MRGFGYTKLEKFFSLFNEAARNAHQGARALQQMLENFRGTADEWVVVEEYEHEGDKISHRIFQALHKSRLRVGEQEAVRTLTSRLDDVLDVIEASAARLAMYKVEKVTPEAKRLTDIILRSTEQIVQGVSALPDLERVQPHCIEINRLENEADDLARTSIANLFLGDTPPLEVFKWKEIYETLETVTDHCEDVADLLEEIALKYR